MTLTEISVRSPQNAQGHFLHQCSPLFFAHCRLLVLVSPRPFSLSISGLLRLHNLRKEENVKKRRKRKKAQEKNRLSHRSTFNSVSVISGLFHEKIKFEYLLCSMLSSLLSPTDFHMVIKSSNYEEEDITLLFISSPKRNRRIRSRSKNQID